MPKFHQSLLASILCLIALASQTEAADFKVLPDSPFRTECWMQLVTGTIEAGSFVRGVIPPCGDTQTGAYDRNYGTFLDKSDLIEQGRWQFWNPDTNRPELRLDGAWSFNEIHDVAAIGTLINSPMILLEGPIEPGDAARFETFLRARNLIDCLAEGYCPFQNVLALDSPGGSLSEALKIAEIVKRYSFPVLIPAEAVCASACSFVFFAGYTEYENFFHSRRFIHETGRLMVHRPSVTLDDRTFSSGEVGQILKIFDEVKEEAVRQFLSARIPRLVLLRMYETPSETLATISLPQMTGFATVVGSGPLHDARPSRAGILGFCAFQYESRTGRMHDDILINLDVRDDSFLTWIEKENFLCSGARIPGEGWYFDTCHDDGYYCNFDGYAQSDASEGQLQLDAEFETYGALLASMSGSARHAFVKRAFDWAAGGVEELPSWVAVAPVPSSYCGKLDNGAPETVKSVQRALNATGYDAGPEDGMMGARTAKALTAAVLDSGLVYDGVLTENLLIGLGVSVEMMATMRLCNN